MKRYVLLPVLLAFYLLLSGCGGGIIDTDWDMCWDIFDYPALDRTTWTTVKGTPTVSEGYLVLDGGPGGGDEVYSKAQFRSGHRVKVRAKATQWVEGTSVGFEGSGGTPEFPWRYAIVFTNDHLSISNGITEWRGAINPPLERGKAYDIEIQWLTEKVDLLIDGQVKSTYDNSLSYLLPAEWRDLRVRLRGSSNFTDQLTIDEVRVQEM